MNESTNVHCEHDDDVPLRQYIERIQEIERTSHEDRHARETRAHEERHKRENDALEYARVTLEGKVAEARQNIVERHGEVVRRLDVLESGGAPFANRLDEGLQVLKDDVELLKKTTIRQEALDQTANDARRTRIAFYVSVGLLAIGVILNFVINVVQH